MTANMDIALMASQLTVSFYEIRDKYPNDATIECKFTLNNYKAQSGDRIAIFVTGWKSLRDYVLFEWVTDSPQDLVYSVYFSKYDLPKGEAPNDLFQFCYISTENIVQGISTPFQISQESSNHHSQLPFLQSPLKDSPDEVSLKRLLREREQEIDKLKDENLFLKESLKTVMDQRKVDVRIKNYDDDIRCLKELTGMLKAAFIVQQKEMEEIKTELRKERAQQKNLMLEKIIAEKKFDALSRQEPKKIIESKIKDLSLDELKSIPPFPLDY